VTRLSACRADLLIELPDFLLVENDEVETILESLERDGDGFVLIDLLSFVASAGIELAANDALLDVAGRQSMQEPAFPPAGP